MLESLLAWVVALVFSMVVASGSIYGTLEILCCAVEAAVDLRKKIARFFSKE